MRYRPRNLVPFAVALVVAGSIALGFATKLLPERGAVVAPAIAPAALEATNIPDAGFEHLFRVGVAMLMARRFEDGAQAFHLARELRPHVPELYVNLGYAYLGLARNEAAMSAFHQAIDLRPAQSNAYYGLAEALDALGDAAGALGAMRTYLHLTRENDPFRRRAMAAAWELEASVAQANAAPPPPADGGARPADSETDAGE